MLKSLTIKEVQSIAFDLFLCFDKICTENHLRYFLSGGTLLGAVRHKGFIPWDDDMDVMMPRSDYERLLTLNLNLPTCIELASCETEHDYFFPFAKLYDKETKIHFEHHISEKSIGIFIDIFPIDGLPGNSIISKYYFSKMKVLNILRNAALRNEFLKGEKFRIIKKVILPYARKKGANYYANQMNEYAQKYNFDDCYYTGVTMITHYGERERMNACVFHGYEIVTFKGKECPAPKLWDEYLTKLYGDYMKLPPKEQQCTDHANFSVEIR